MMERPAAEIKAAWKAAGLRFPHPNPLPQGEGTEESKAANMADWLESKLHSEFTELADELFGNGQLTRPERIALSGLIGDALEVFHQGLQDAVLAGVRERSPWEDAPASAGSAYYDGFDGKNVPPAEEPGRGAENARSAKDGRADSDGVGSRLRGNDDGDGDAGDGSAREIDFELERLALLEV